MHVKLVLVLVNVLLLLLLLLYLLPNQLLGPEPPLSLLPLPLLHLAVIA